MNKIKKESFEQLQERYDYFLEVAFKELMRSESTHGWSYDAIARQASTAAEALIHHRKESKVYLECVHAE